MLRLYPRPGHVFYPPGPKPAGSPAPYVGRRTVVKRDASGKPTSITHPARLEPTQVDPDSALGQKVRRRMQLDREDPPFLAADMDTAKALGVPFVPCEFDSELGEWMPKVTAAPKSRKDGDK